jgi:hypothetical protein
MLACLVCKAKEREKDERTQDERPAERLEPNNQFGMVPLYGDRDLGDL